MTTPDPLDVIDEIEHAALAYTPVNPSFPVLPHGEAERTLQVILPALLAELRASRERCAVLEGRVAALEVRATVAR